MSKPTLTYVVIGGVDVTSYVFKWKVERKYDDDIGRVEVFLKRTASAVIDVDDLAIGNTITIQRGVSSATEEYVFRGEVVSVNPSGSYVALECFDKLYEARRRNVTKSFDINIDTEAGKFSEIFKTLINDYTTLTCDDTTVQDSGTAFLLTKFICNNADVYERCTELAKTLGWQFHYNPVTDKVYFEPKGYVNSGVTLTVGQEIAEVPKWTYDSTELANSVKVIGAEQEVGTTEYFDGTGAQTEFILTYTPKSVKVYVGGVLKTGGKEGSTSGTYHYSFDDDTKTITFQSTSIPGAGSNNIQVDYTYMLPAPVIGKRWGSINKYGLREKTLFKDELKTIDDAKNFMNNYIDQYSEPFLNTTLKCSSAAEFLPGEQVAVVDNVNGISDTILVVSIKQEWPYKYDEVEVGNKILKLSDWMSGLHDRVRRLEEKAGKSQDLLLHVIDLTRETIRVQRRYLLLKKKTAGGFIIGNPLYARIGSSPLGNTSTDYTTIRLIPGAEGFCEYLYDTDRIDTDLTTSTIDTTNQQVTS